MSRPWWQQAVIYHMYPRSFMDSNGDGIGDLRGILSKLDYLEWLGVDLLWLCPVFPSPNVDNGYDVSNYCDISPEFGTLADFDLLLAELHRRGMRLMIDLVINHTSDRHPWFIESRSTRSSPRRNWYIWRDGRDGAPPNNWESIFLGPAWTRDDATGQYYLHLFSAHQPDLNWDNPEVRAALCSVACWWLARGVDGFRLDAITHLKKQPGLPDLPDPDGTGCVPSYEAHMNIPGVLDFVHEFARESFRRHDAIALGEANGVSSAQALEWVGTGRGPLDMILQFEHWTMWSSHPHDPLHVPTLRRILGKWQQALQGKGWNALYIENTELPRVISRWGDVGTLRNQSATALATMYFLMQGTPLIYQGQELGMANTTFHDLSVFNDVFSRNRIEQMRAAGQMDDEILAELALTSRDNARTPMPWSDAPQGGFTTGEPWLPLNPEYPAVNVASQQQDPGSVLAYYRKLIRLRRQEAPLIDGRYVEICKRNRRIYAYVREAADGSAIAVICNLSPHPASYRHREWILCHPDLLLSNLSVAPHDDTHSLRLRPFEARVYRVRRRTASD